MIDCSPTGGRRGVKHQRIWLKFFLWLLDMSEIIFHNEQLNSKTKNSERYAYNSFYLEKLKIYGGHFVFPF